jgi:hypothetical protein
MSRNCLSWALSFILIFGFISTSFSQSSKKALQPEISVSFNGKFQSVVPEEGAKAQSPNSRYFCKYRIGDVTHEVRELLDFHFYEDGRLLYTIEKPLGQDLYISNSGFVAFMNINIYLNNQQTIYFFSKNGAFLFSHIFDGANLFAFSPDGNRFGIVTPEGLSVISMLDGTIERYPKCFQFDISASGNIVAIAIPNKVQIFSEKVLIREYQTGFSHTRGIKISPDNNLIAVIDKKNLKVYSLKKNRLLFTKKLRKNKSFRDLIVDDGKIVTGVHYRDQKVSSGILRKYDFGGNVLTSEVKQSRNIEKQISKSSRQGSGKNYPIISWPFAPFDSMRTVWNYYEQHMSYGAPDFSYLHQGLDLIVPIGEPTYAVQAGMVKCVLTISAAYHWRIAVSPADAVGWSNGWLYAHLIENTIQFDVGDTVQVHDYLGDIVQWSSTWGHIHFVEIRDSGAVWYYNDNEWGINYNPLKSLQPDSDLTSPIIDTVFGYSKFAFCTNETSTYLNPDSLYGDIDVIVKIRDFVGDSQWEQPAFETYYWIEKLPEKTEIFPKTLGQVLNHSYSFYESSNYEPWATVIYKRDQILIPSSWNDMQRNYYHILTNNNGDSLIELSEKNLAFHTGQYLDGDYRIFVEARDEFGNAALDSMDVKFKNGNITSTGDLKDVPFSYKLEQNYPNPFNPKTSINVSVAESGQLILTIFDILGRKVTVLKNEVTSPGNYTIAWDATALTGGVYFYRMEINDFSATRKMLLLK